MNNDVILPGATLGVLGGGQLGRMFVHAAQSMGYFTAVLDQDATSPAGLVSHHHVRTGYEDPQGLAELARVCAAVTTEFENVPAGALNTLAQNLPVSPAGSAVAIAQDRAQEKAQPPGNRQNGHAPSAHPLIVTWSTHHEHPNRGRPHGRIPSLRGQSRDLARGHHGRCR